MAKDSYKEKLKILFVDDEEGVLRSLGRLFFDEDFVILTAPSGTSGLEILKSNNVAVIVSDQKMPGMSGAEFLEKAKRIAPDSIRIVLTGYADINAAMDAINKGGAYRYITKPWDDNDLIITVLNAIEMYKLGKENKRLTELTRKQNEELRKWSAELEGYVQQQTIDLTNQNKELQKLNTRLRKNIKEFILTFYNLIELRNKSLYIHSNNVATLVSDIVQKMGLPDSDAEAIITAAQLHDIGKIGISDTVILKNTKEFSSDEMADYIRHPVIGQSVIDTVEDLRHAGTLIRHHHEWYNGNGFPDKLKYEKIPLGSRIISIADKFEKLTFGSSAQEETENALIKIKLLLGSQFDPDMFKPFSEAARNRTTAALPEAEEKVEVEMKPGDLAPGFVLSKDVRSGTGLLLLRKGAVLNEKSIETMRRSYHIDPAKSGVFIWSKRRREKA